ncbi:glycosyl hydrolase family 28-related protein [Paraglaciecola sp.]|uniref:glycosyl hydrolase family 28-related protein n=1 Tax=Paraglaciecola sp. TaxID=1920173 RepID=UPI0030F435D3
MKSKIKLLLVILTIFISSCTSIFQQSILSDLWGSEGELWSADSRLPDFSHAGLSKRKYNNDLEKQLLDVTDFGAVGDGITDSTEAFKSAISAVEKGVVFIPEGRYVISDVITISKSNIELRGAGLEKTILLFPHSLTEIKGPLKISGYDYSVYSFGRGILQVSGKQSSHFITKINKNALRGDKVLAVDNAAQFKVGQFVRLTMGNPVELGQYLHDGQNAGEDTLVEFDNLVDTVLKIVEVGDKYVVIDRPLRTDVDTNWSPSLNTFHSSVSNVGITNLAIEFPNVAKKEHLKEDGYNAIVFNDVTDTWVKNVKITNADNALSLFGVRFCEIDHIVLNSDRKQEITGHHGLWAKSGTQGCVLSDFLINTKFVHDLTVEGLAHGNVFKNGQGLALNFDHHRNAPYENLFSNIYVGSPERIWRSSGNRTRGPHSGVRTTFWNLHFKDKNLSKIPDWPQLNYIGLSNQPDSKSESGKWLENTKWLFPEELHEAQRNANISKRH